MPWGRPRARRAWPVWVQESQALGRKTWIMSKARTPQRLRRVGREESPVTSVGGGKRWSSHAKIVSNAWGAFRCRFRLCPDLAPTPMRSILSVAKPLEVARRTKE
jgi:hypothetical protein